LISRHTFEKIYNRYYASLYYYAKRFVIEQKEAEDIVADTFIKFWKAEGRFDGEQPIKSFLYTVTRNSCLDFMRAAKRQDIHYEEYHYLYSQDEAAFFLEDDVRATVLRLLLESIDQLPPKCRKIFKMAYLERISNEDIAKQLDLSYQTVKNQKVRGLKILKDRFAGVDVFLSPIFIFILLFV
jgi:RNA polymerase sigma-70 factor (family 1)